MSVVKSKRSQSQLEFLRTARSLQIYTVQKCVNTIPKRYTIYIGTELSRSAARSPGWWSWFISCSAGMTAT